MAQKPVTLPRESVELVVINVTVDGQPITEFDVAAAEIGERPTDFEPALVINGDAGYLTGFLEAGLYNLYARVTDEPETVVLHVGTLNIE